MINLSENIINNYKIRNTFQEKQTLLSQYVL